MFTKKISSYQNNPEKYYTEKKANHEPSGYSRSLICSFNAEENRHKFYTEKDLLKSFVKI